MCWTTRIRILGSQDFTAISDEHEHEQLSKSDAISDMVICTFCNLTKRIYFFAKFN